MKILIGTSEIANWVNLFQESFENQGHKVKTAVYNRHKFYDKKYDIDLNEHSNKNRFKRELRSDQYFLKIKRKVQNKIADFIFERYIYKLIDEHDLIIKIWHPFLNQSKENRYIKKKNKKLINIFLGTDVRYFSAFQQEYDISQWTFPAEFTKSSIEYQINLIRNAEKYADLIYSVPDQAGLQLRPYYHVHVPIDSKNIEFRNNKRTIPKIVHIPSIPFKKGTDIIEKTLTALKNDGLKFTFMSLRDLTHKEVLTELADADILVDELIFFGPGALGFEAMLSGCAVATRFNNKSKQCFNPPVWPIDFHTIYNQIRILISDNELRNSLIEEGRIYAVKNNEVDFITSNILNDLNEIRRPDYFPDFLVKYYKPKENEVNLINAWTGYVKNCKWYSQYLSPLKRSRLRF